MTGAVGRALICCQYAIWVRTVLGERLCSPTCVAILMSNQDKPRLEELPGPRVENRTIVWVYLVAFVVAVIIGLILRFAINAAP